MTLNGFFCALNEEVNNKGLKLVIIRNFEGLPKLNYGNDIDLLVRDSDLNVWLESLTRVCTLNKLELKVTKVYSYCTKLHIFGVDDKGKGYLELDLNNLLVWKCVEFYSMDELIDGAKLVSKPIYTCDKKVAAFVTFCHSFLYGGFFQFKYSELYLSLESKEGERFFYDAMAEFSPISISNVIYKELTSGKPSLSRLKINLFRVIFICFSLIRSPLKFLNNFCRMIKSSFLSVS